MERSRLLQCLAAEYMRLRDVAATGWTAAVPSCPGWSVADLVRHVGLVYLHKAEVMHTGAWPDPWPPAEAESEEPLALLDRGYAALTHEFSRRGDTDPCPTWHGPDQTVMFWIRRMAQESVIHRLDAELAHHTEPAPIPLDLALDGIDELLQLFLAYASKTWPEDFTGILADSPARTVRIEAVAPGSADALPESLVTAYAAAATVSTATAGPPPTAPAASTAPALTNPSAPSSSASTTTPALASDATPPSGTALSAPSPGRRSGSDPSLSGPPSPGDALSADPSATPPAHTEEATGPTPAVLASWQMRLTPGGITATTGIPDPQAIAADAVVTGPPDHLLRWLWSRESIPTTDVHPPIEVKGDEQAIKQLRTLLTAGTQ